MKRTIHQWIEEYGQSHQNPTNKAIHWVCVPLIMLSLLALISLIPFPTISNSQSPDLNWTVLFLFFAVIFYLRLSISIAIGMLLIALSMLYSILLIEIFNPSIWQVSLIIFIGAWIGQFIGHKIEGGKPSFFEDIQFLLIGPAWLLSFIYKKIGIKL